MANENRSAQRGADKPKRNGWRVFGRVIGTIVLVGVLTGVGGGVVRDVLAGDTPYIFVKHIYACASLAGAVSMTALRGVLPIYASMLLSAVLVFVIRLLSAHFRWNLPRVRNL